MMRKLMTWLGIIVILSVGCQTPAQSRPAAPPASQAANATRSTTLWPGFVQSPHFSEQTREYVFDPGVKIHINAPAPGTIDPAKPAMLVLYCLPNGNTTAQTIGRRMAPGVDWHFDIQHIGAQTRRLREIDPAHTWIVAYLEADGRSWPTWKTKHTDFPKIIPAVLGDIRAKVPLPKVSIALSAHSGGGSFIFGYLDSVERIPNDVVRIAFLDANYGFIDGHSYAEKLIDWLKRSRDHHLNVVAYDDRDVVLNGKNIVGPDGGTYRKTLRMLERFRKDIDFTETKTEAYGRHRGLNGQVEMILHENPARKILHTALVGEMSGFIHVMTSGTDLEGRAATFKGPRTYDKWIQPE